MARYFLCLLLSLRASALFSQELLLESASSEASGGNFLLGSQLSLLQAFGALPSDSCRMGFSLSSQSRYGLQGIRQDGLALYKRNKTLSYSIVYQGVVEKSFAEGELRNTLLVRQGSQFLGISIGLRQLLLVPYVSEARACVHLLGIVKLSSKTEMAAALINVFGAHYSDAVNRLLPMAMHLSVKSQVDEHLRLSSSLHLRSDEKLVHLAAALHYVPVPSLELVLGLSNSPIAYSFGAKVKLKAYELMVYTKTHPFLPMSTGLQLARSM